MSNSEQPAAAPLNIDCDVVSRRETWWVSLCKEQLIFSAAHFITFAGDICERIHGHNYRVKCEVRGPLDENHYVIDFIALRDGLLELTSALDHHVLLPDRHPLIRVADDGKEVTVTFRDKRWVFPSEDAIILPIPNTTAELLAKYLGAALLHRLKEKGLEQPRGLRMAVDENEGQWGIVEWSFDEPAP
ncbi:MAG: 6-pyruvoyl tetrahydropterin synthase family protein [Planctomycetales bacterium]|nr:6-pyruvoyl tetrahydropterin synthase family protein [Planctomycetales bacterium]